MHVICKLRLLSFEVNEIAESNDAVIFSTTESYTEMSPQNDRTGHRRRRTEEGKKLQVAYQLTPVVTPVTQKKTGKIRRALSDVQPPHKSGIFRVNSEKGNERSLSPKPDRQQKLSLPNPPNEDNDPVNIVLYRPMF